VNATIAVAGGDPSATLGIESISSNGAPKWLSLDDACILGRGREDPGTTSLDGGRKHGHVATTLSLELDPEIDGPCVRLEIGRYREPA